MNQNYGRDLDLNLLRVFVVVADVGSVTKAATQLYLTQPAVSAALRRLDVAVGAKLFARSGRGIRLTGRGEDLLRRARPHLTALVESTTASPTFDPKKSDNTLRLGLSDSAEGWLLPPLLASLEREAPRMRVIVLPVRFRTVGDAILSRAVDMAITVADDLPQSIKRKALFKGGFVCLYDPARVKLPKVLRARDYFAEAHAIVSYNGDLRGVVEDVLHKTRNVRCSVPSFSHIGDVVHGSSLLATVPEVVATYLKKTHPRLRTAKLPFSLEGTAVELLWPRASDDDAASIFFRDQVERICGRARRS